MHNYLIFFAQKQGLCTCKHFLSSTLILSLSETLLFSLPCPLHSASNRQRIQLKALVGNKRKNYHKTSKHTFPFSIYSTFQFERRCKPAAQEFVESLYGVTCPQVYKNFASEEYGDGRNQIKIKTLCYTMSILPL